MINVRNLVLCLDCDLQLENVELPPGTEIYSVSTADDIDVRIASDLHRPVRLVFVTNDIKNDLLSRYPAAFTFDQSSIMPDLLTGFLLTVLSTPVDEPWNLPTGVDLITMSL